MNIKKLLMALLNDASIDEIKACISDSTVPKPSSDGAARSADSSGSPSVLLESAEAGDAAAQNDEAGYSKNETAGDETDESGGTDAPHVPDAPEESDVERSDKPEAEEGSDATEPAKAEAASDSEADSADAPEAGISREEMISAYRKYLAGLNLSYKYDSEKGMLSMPFSLKNRLNQTVLTLYFPAGSTYCRVRAHLQQTVPAHCKKSILEFIAARNIRFVFGRFLFEDAALVYEYVCEYGGLREITDQFISRSYMIPLESLQSCGDALMDIITSEAEEEGASGSGGSSEPRAAGEEKKPSACLTPDDALKLFCAEMTSQGYNYRTDDEKKMLTAVFHLASDIARASLVVNFNASGYMIRFEAEPKTPEENRGRMTEALNRWNYDSFQVGSCEMSPEDGRIFYRYFIIYADIAELPRTIIARSIRYALDAFDHVPKEVLNLLLGVVPEGEEQNSSNVIEFPHGRRNCDKEG